MNRKSYPKNWDRNEAAGSDWLRGFMERNPVLSLRTPEATSLSRSTSFNKHTVGVFFDKLREVLAREQFPPSSIWNVDESGLITVHKPGKIIAEKGVKQVGKVTSGERGSLVALWSPEKYYNTAAADWMLMNPGKTITIYEVAGLLGIAFPQAVTPKNIMSGFISSGIWPLNSNIFTDYEFLTSYVTDRPNPVKEPLPLVENSVASSSEISGQTTPTKLPKAKEHFTPEEIRPFPKAPPRIAQSARGRKRGSSRILTDTPEKNKIENVIAKTKKT
ncbi:hypothetical protein ANN_00746 [Periplaneta americana]|uniref:HTH CENPB-type domain-containing protein n=1 Tax=Periplaneta americana TaxID=6978 RepID=A0ABQ8TSQ9_PERAM|nr:hypothetical protein ANN_00746 [Periplaneta americana]